MAENDGDGGVEEAINSTARVALTLAMQLGEKLAKLREEMMRDAERRDAAAARELTARFESERGVARAELAVVNRPEWWDNASVRDVARVAETAHSWRGQDESAAAAFEVISTEIRSRHGVELDELVTTVRNMPPERSELEQAKNWAQSDATPDYYHRGDADRLEYYGEDRREADSFAEMDLKNDWKAATAEGGSIPEASLAQEWAYSKGENADSPQYAGKSSAEIQALLIETWRAEAPEFRSDAARDRTEAAQLLMEADRLDRAAAPADRPMDGQPSELVAQLEAQARAYDADADRGGVDGKSPDELRELATDARSQAQLYRDEAAATHGVEEPAQQRSAESTANRADAGNAYDSAERREAFAASLDGKGSPEDARVRIRADVDQARPAHEAVTAKSSSRARAGRSGGGARTRDRGDRSR